MRAPRSREHSEDGFTLLELLIAMFIMAIVFTIVMQAMTGWVVNTERRDTQSDGAQDQIEQAFQTLDSEVRYAYVIDTPAESTTTAGDVGDYWVEFESDWTATSQSSPTCYQVEYVTSTGVLQQRSWLGTGSPPTSAAWRTLATGLASAPSGSGLSTGNPFSLTKTAPNLKNAATPTTTTTTTPSTTTTTLGSTTSETESTPWELTVSLSSTVGSGLQAGSAATSFTIAAIDVTSDSDSAGVVCGGSPS